MMTDWNDRRTNGRKDGMMKRDNTICLSHFRAGHKKISELKSKHSLDYTM